MIIDFRLRCNDHHEKTEEELMGLKCPKCGAVGLKYYSTYERWALTLETDVVGCLGLKTWRLTITRVKCGCNKTHAILPGDIIPYKQYSLDTAVSILTFVMSGSLSVECVEKMLGVPHQVIYGIIRQWTSMLIKLALLLRVTYHLYTITDAQRDAAPILEFVANNNRGAPQAYLKYYRWPMFMTHGQNAAPQKANIGISE